MFWNTDHRQKIEESKKTIAGLQSDLATNQQIIAGLQSDLATQKQINTVLQGELAKESQINTNLQIKLELQQQNFDSYTQRVETERMAHQLSDGVHRIFDLFR
jgi:paraquat-inducible protein B